MLRRGVCGLLRVLTLVDPPGVPKPVFLPRYATNCQIPRAPARESASGWKALSACAR